MDPAARMKLEAALPEIQSRAAAHDRTGAWPEEDLRALAGAGAWRWAAPSEFGGDDLSALALHMAYERIASASLATALIVSQRDSAVSLIDSVEESPLRAELLPALA